jgi:hypothetical protein
MSDKDHVASGATDVEGDGQADTNADTSKTSTPPTALMPSAACVTSKRDPSLEKTSPLVVIPTADDTGLVTVAIKTYVLES